MKKRNVKKGRLIGIRKKNAEQGYTLLEYCAGAAVIAGIVFGALNTLGTNLEGLLGALGNWATARANEIEAQVN